ncbi:MAG: DUF6470 family protein [Clostridia bacterium]|nr:DUF6470 family protein [Clostridia bacterium]
MIGQLIQVNVEKPQLQIRTTPSQFRVERDPPKLEIEREEGGLSISATPAKCIMDLSACRAQAGVQSACAAVSDNAQKGLEAAQEAAGEAATEGDLLLDGGRDTLCEIAREKSMPTPQSEGYSPYTMPDISWQPAQLKISYTADTLDVHFTQPQLKIEAEAGTVRVYTAGSSSVNFTYTGEPIYPHAIDLKA